MLRDLRSALLIVVATTLSGSALPYISSATQRLAKACGIEDPDTGEIVRTNISVAYPLGQLGNFFVYLFIVFALCGLADLIRGRSNVPGALARSA